MGQARMGGGASLAQIRAPQCPNLSAIPPDTVDVLEAGSIPGQNGFPLGTWPNRPFSAVGS